MARKLKLRRDKIDAPEWSKFNGLGEKLMTGKDHRTLDGEAYTEDELRAAWIVHREKVEAWEDRNARCRADILKARPDTVFADDDWPVRAWCRRFDEPSE